MSPDECTRGTVCHSSLGLKFQEFCAFSKLTASLRSSQNEGALKMLAFGDFHSKTLQVLRRRDKGHKWFWDITSDTSDVTLYAPNPSETTPKVAVVMQVTHNGLAFMSRLQSFKSWALRHKPSESTQAVSPAIIVIRAAEIYFAGQYPKMRNHLVIQALVKFDTA